MNDARADLRLGEAFLGVLVRPRATFARLAEEPNARAGASAIALLGFAWSVLSILLFVAGHAAPVVLLPIAPEDYYLAQGILVLPILTALWWLHSEVVHAIARRLRGTGTEGGTRAALGFAYAAPMLIHVLAELSAYLAAGLEGLRVVARVSLPLAALYVWALSAVAVRASHRVGIVAAIGASFTGLVLQALLGALVLR